MLPSQHNKRMHYVLLFDDLGKVSVIYKENSVPM